MKMIQRLSAFAPVLLLVANLFRPVGHLEAQATTIPLDLSTGRPVVQVMIDGRGPYGFIFDTGARRNVIDTSMVTQLGLTSVGTDSVRSPGAPAAVSVSVHETNRMSASGRDFGVQQFVGLDRRQFGGSDSVIGVIGRPVMQDLLVTLDFPKQLLEMVPGRLVLGGDVMAFDRNGPQIQISADFAGLSVPVNLDTGSPIDLILPRSIAGSLPLVQAPQVIGRARLVGNVAELSQAQLNGVATMGGLTFDRPMLRFLDADLPAGNMGTGALADTRVTLDVTNGLVRFESVARSNSAAPAGGRGGSLGVQLGRRGDAVLIMTVVSGSIAERAGLRAQDEILDINGVAVGTLDRGGLVTALQAATVITVRRGDQIIEIQLNP